jgi:glycosyltransferase involved in cell wall biosynthesis
MRALHVVSTLDRGGIAASLRQLLPVLTEGEGVDIEVAILYGESQYRTEMCGFGIPIHHLRLTSKYDGRGVFRLAQLFRSDRYQIIHAHGWPAVLLVALASLLAGRSLPFIMTEHSVTNRRRRWRLKPLDQFVYSRFQHVIAVSRAAAEALADWLPQVRGRITLIYNGLDPAFFNRAGRDRDQLRAELGIHGRQPVILFAGGMAYHKGTDVILQALAQLQTATEQGGDPLSAPLTLIAGDGVLDETTKGLAAGLEQTGQVRFLGFCSNLADLMVAADLFVLASRWEGCPMVMLEAMAMELPIIATRVGGVPELIEDGQSGLLVPAGDVVALSQAVSHLLSNGPLASHLGCMARRRVGDCFMVEQGSQALAAVYQSVLLVK